MSKRVFLSGPISGVKDYRERFAEKAAEVWNAGDVPFDPALIELGPDATPADYLLECLEELVKCDAICFLPGARKSKGSLIEREFAKYAGIPEVKYEG